MPRVSILPLLMLVALCAPGACLAQMRAQAPEGAPASTADDSAPSGGDMRTEETRSAFGRVMAVMIAALQRQSADQSRPAAPVRTTAAGTPMDIEVGAAFRDAMSMHAEGDRPAVRRATATGGVAAATLPRATPPENPVLREATLAGPD